MARAELCRPFDAPRTRIRPGAMEKLGVLAMDQWINIPIVYSLYRNTKHLWFRNEDP